MSITNAKLGLLVPLVPQTSKEKDVHNFLLTGYNLVQDEPLTSQWFAVKYTDGSKLATTYAIFDTFATEEGRTAHLTGKIAEALVANAPTLLDPAPEIGQVRILARKVVSSSASGGNTAGLSVGLRVLFTAKPEKVDTVREFLEGARSLVDEESNTYIWYAFEYPGTGQFGIVDFFPHEKGRDEHINGKVAEALFGSVDELLIGQPDLVKVDVLAAMVR